MARIELTAEEAAFIASRIAAYEVEHQEQLHLGSAKELNALPLYFDWSGAIGIRPDGEIVHWDYDNLDAGTLEVVEIVWVRTALVTGAKRYPNLRQLIPVRTANAVTCETCNGTGTMPQFPRVICCCSGLGWVDEHSST
jgi:hypothetical protein